MTQAYLTHTYGSKHEEGKVDRLMACPYPSVSSTMDEICSKNKRFRKYLT